VNIDTEWAKLLTTQILWADVTAVAELLEQRKFKAFYADLVSYH